MGITNKCNIEEDQLLAEEIRKYPCLYNKSEKSYLDQTMKESAWRNVDAAMGYGQDKLGSHDSHGIAEKKFVVLRKRYSRKKLNLRKASLTIGVDDITKRQKEFDEYHFMEWLDPYMMTRVSKEEHIANLKEDTFSESSLNEEFGYGNTSIIKEIAEKSKKNGTACSSTGRRQYQSSREYENNVNIESSTGRRQYQSSRECENNVNLEANNDTVFRISNDIFDNIAHVKVERVSENGSPEEAGYENDRSIVEAATKYPQTGAACSSIPKKRYRENIARKINASIDTNEVTTRRPSERKEHSTTLNARATSDDIFGSMIAAELKNFPSTVKFKVKHEINLVLYKYHLVLQDNIVPLHSPPY